MTTLTAIPQQHAAGTSLEVRRFIPTHTPQNGWAYQLAMRIPGYTPKDGAADGDAFVLTLSAQDTAAWPPGTYAFSERAVKGGVVHEVGVGTITITPNLAVLPEGDDGLTHNQRVLKIIEAQLEGRLADGIQNYSIGGRVVSKIPLKELVELRDKYKVKVLLERTGGQLGQVLFTFGSTR